MALVTVEAANVHIGQELLTFVGGFNLKELIPQLSQKGENSTATRIVKAAEALLAIHDERISSRKVPADCAHAAVDSINRNAKLSIKREDLLETQTPYIARVIRVMQLINSGAIEKDVVDAVLSTLVQKGVPKQKEYGLVIAWLVRVGADMSGSKGGLNLPIHEKYLGKRLGKI